MPNFFKRGAVDLDAAGGGVSAPLATYTWDPATAGPLSQKVAVADAWVPASPANEAALTFTPAGSEVLLVWDTFTFNSVAADYFFGALTTAGALVPGSSRYVSSNNGSLVYRLYAECRVPVTAGVATTWVWGQMSRSTPTMTPAYGGGNYGPCTFKVYDG